MPSLESILISVREDVIINRVGAVTPAKLIDERWQVHGDPQDMDDSGQLEKLEGPARLFDVYITDCKAIAMSGSTTQPYIASCQIHIFYPKTIKGKIASIADKAAIDCELNKNDNLPDGVELYIVLESQDTSTLIELDDYDITVIQVDVRLVADI